MIIKDISCLFGDSNSCVKIMSRVRHIGFIPFERCSTEVEPLRGALKVVIELSNFIKEARREQLYMYRKRAADSAEPSLG